MTSLTYQTLIESAKQALRNGERVRARKLAQEIVAQFPDGFEGLMILGGLSTPEESLHCLTKAHEIAPDDPRVNKALAWVNARLNAASFPVDDEQTVKIQVAPISEQPATEKRGLVWVWAVLVILILSGLFLVMGILPRYPNQVSSHFNISLSTQLSKAQLTATPNLVGETISLTSTSTEILTFSPTPTATPTPTSTPTPTPTPTIIPDLYGSFMEIRFTSGPLEDYGTTFTMIDRDYFYNKGNIFDPGNNTGVYYENQRYLILHSGYEDGNLSYPLEAEFMRKYLESWGTSGTDYIEAQIEALKGSQMLWISNNQKAAELQLVQVIRLSHDSSSQLWLEPQNLLQIIADREGVESEWIGEMHETETPSVYIAFCGWGPSSITVNRSIYYRYILRFDIIT